MLNFPLDNQERGSIENARFKQLQAFQFKGGIPVLTAIPTYVGTQGEIVSVDDGANRQIYLYLNGTWRAIGGFNSKARAYRATSAQVIPDGAWTKVQLNAESYDILGEFDSTTNYRFTAQAAGYYVITGAATFEANATGARIIALRKNNSQCSQGTLLQAATGIYGDAGNASDIQYLAIGDYIELFVFQTSGGNLNVVNSTAGNELTHLAIHRLS